MGAATGLDGDGGETKGAFFGDRLSRWSLLFPFHAVDALDHQEHGEGYDNKADDGVNEGSPVEGYSTGRFGCSQGSIRSSGLSAFFKHNEEVSKIHVAQ